MANIAITSHCNLNCSYCFTQEEYNSVSNSQGNMSLPVFQKALEFIKKSNLKRVSILGGEPTLHKDCVQYLDMAFDMGLPVTLFSNGMIPRKILEYLEKVPQNKLHIVLNVTQLVENSFKMPKKLEMTLQHLHAKITPGLNIYNKDIPLDFLLDLIRHYNLNKTIRLGLAHPCIEFKNQYLLPKHYFHVGQKIIHFARKSLSESVKINLDCGFVPCMFGNEDLGQIGLATNVGLQCEPIPDILPDGSIVSCYPLSGNDRKNISSFSSLKSLRDHYKEQTSKYKSIGIFNTCSNCEYKKRNLCTGGCTANKILRFNRIPKVSFDGRQPNLV